MVNEKENDSIKRKICSDKRTSTFLKDLPVVLNNHGSHELLTNHAFLRSFPISVFRNLESEANNLYDKAFKSYKAAV